MLSYFHSSKQIWKILPGSSIVLPELLYSLLFPTAELPNSLVSRWTSTSSLIHLSPASLCFFSSYHSCSSLACQWQSSSEIQRTVLPKSSQQYLPTKLCSSLQETFCLLHHLVVSDNNFPRILLAFAIFMHNSLICSWQRAWSPKYGLLLVKHPCTGWSRNAKELSAHSRIMYQVLAGRMVGKYSSSVDLPHSPPHSEG